MKLQCTSHGIPREATAPSDDAVRIQQRNDTFIGALADGLGAAKDGGIAARRAVEMITDYFLSRPQAWSARRALSEFAAQISRQFYQESHLRHGAPEMLCTLSVVAIEGGRLYGLNVGDSPIFLWRRGQLTRLSEMHSLASDGLQHVLTKAIGLTPALEPFLFETATEVGDLILVCSDGVSTALDQAHMARLLERRAGARSFVTAAQAAASENEELRDDASAFVVEITEIGWNLADQRRGVEVVTNVRSGDSFDAYTLSRPLEANERVWLASDPEGKRVVVKFAPLDARNDEARQDAFVREAWQASRIDSPDFVRASVPAAGALRYYVMEYVEAPTLKSVLAEGPLMVEEAVELGRFLLRAGQFLLSRELAHGDIKPENILVVRDGDTTRFKILDMGGVAQVFSVTSRAGTPSYLAPERFKGAALSERTELFSVGVTLYEALARTYPYGEVERFQTPRFEGPPKRLPRLNPAVPDWLDSVIMRALAPEPERRYQNFSEMAYEFEHPENVLAYHGKDTPLIERNPVLFYKVLCILLLVTNLILLARLGLR